MNYTKKIISVALLMIIVVSITLIGFSPINASGTGAGLAEWALNAYYSKWSYVYGGSSPGAVDCSGLIYSYCGGARTGNAQLSSGTARGNVSAGIPRIHGLGLYQPGHVGVYVGNGMAVDARGSQWGVCYQSTATKAWTQWFKVSAVSYVTNGWEKFNGKYYYYEDGEYVVNCSREIGGVTYTFSSSGASNKKPEDMSAVANKNSNSSNNKTTNATKPSTSATEPATTQPNTTATTEPTTTQPDLLQLGVSGDKVTKLQNRLIELGFYDGVATGYFGEATEEAYKAFQKAANVTIDGIAGESDLEILYSSSAPKAVIETEPETEEPTQELPEETEPVDDGIYVVGEQCDEIVNIQNKLLKLGYFNFECTGYFGDLTLTAVSAFQKANGLDATGEVDEKTYQVLFSENALENPYYEEPAEETVAEENNNDNFYNDQMPSNDAFITTAQIEKLAQDNIEIAKKVTLKTNKIANKALFNLTNDVEINEIDIQNNNKNFFLWLLLVGGIVIISTVVVIFANRYNSYEYAHAKRKSKYGKHNVRYW